MKRLTALLLAIAALFTLTACGQKSPVHEHVWQEADCLTPKTCADCGETEGEPLGHKATEATHWAPSVCSACGEELGEALIPDFEKYGYKVINASEVPTEHALTVDATNRIVSAGLQYNSGRQMGGYNSNYSICRGDVVLKEREVFDGDEEHPAADGYEWRYYEFELIYPQWSTPDGTIGTGGYQPSFTDDDYYDIAARDDSARGLHYTVTWQGEEYADCMRIVTYSDSSTKSFPLEGYGSIPVWQHSCYVWVRVPVGYDGAMFAFKHVRDKLSPGMHIYDLPKSATSEMTFIRLN